MPRLDPAVAAVRLAVRRALAGLGPGPVAVACSGGADSTALLAATVFEARRTPRRVLALVVDHGLQPCSAEHTARVTARLGRVGADATASARVEVDPVPRGLEAGAREARYAALAALAEERGAAAVLLGHTRDDQAETVLLGLTQGSGARSLAGMPTELCRHGTRFVRPLLGVGRAETAQACAAQDLPVWQDPHNADPRFARTRVRDTVIPTLERELGPGIAAALARTGAMLADDTTALDELARADLVTRDFEGGEECRALTVLPRALRSRVLRLAALAAGCPPRELTHDHVAALDDLVLDPRGGARAADLPGLVRAVREHGRLRLDATAGTDPGRPGGTA